MKKWNTVSSGKPRFQSCSQTKVFVSLTWGPRRLLSHPWIWSNLKSTQQGMFHIFLVFLATCVPWQWFKSWSRKNTYVFQDYSRRFQSWHILVLEKWNDLRKDTSASGWTAWDTSHVKGVKAWRQHLKDARVALFAGHWVTKLRRLHLQKFKLSCL